MKRSALLSAALTLSGLLSTAQADDPTGWKEVPWGSSPEDIEKIEDITELDEEDIENKYFRGELHKWKYELEEYKVAGFPFRVRFYFDLDDKFSAYTLEWEVDEDYAEDGFDELVRLLEERYQRKSIESETEVSFGNNFLVTCELGKVDDGDRKITITYLDSNEDQVDRL